MPYQHPRPRITESQARTLRRGCGLSYEGSDGDWHYAEVEGYRASDDRLIVSRGYSGTFAVPPAVIAADYRLYGGLS